ncbi:MAG: thiamine pyrophosphate-dependent enzyme [Myxococcota bacterium]|nr:thiamine pyrophosphate-dependent enzyme [Myxococcota bacterium]
MKELALLADPPDVVGIVGSRLGEIATNGWTLPLAGTADTIQIDRDPLLLGCNVAATLGIVGDAKAALHEITRSVPGGAAIPATTHIGEHLTMALHFLRIDEPSRFHALTGLGSMGSGIGSAIGIKHALPHATVVAVCGDGGPAMHAGELLTCVENQIGVVFAVFNDGRWNMIHHGFRSVYGRLPPSLPSRVADLAAVAKGFGAVSAIIRRPEDLQPGRLRRHFTRSRVTERAPDATLRPVRTCLTLTARCLGGRISSFFGPQTTLLTRACG